DGPARRRHGRHARCAAGLTSKEEIHMQTLRSMTLSTGLLAAALVVASGPSWAQKTVKQCDAEWQANKGAIQASGKTKKDYVASCRQASSAAASTTPRPAAKSTANPPQLDARTSSRRAAPA